MSLYAIFEKKTKSYCVYAAHGMYSTDIDKVTLFKTRESAKKVLSKALKRANNGDYQQIWYVDSFILYNGDLQLFLKNNPSYSLTIAELEPDLEIIEIALIVV